MLNTKISYLLTLSRYEEAFSLIRNDMKTDLTEKMLLRSRILEKQGEFDDAIQLLDEVIKINQLRLRIEYVVIYKLIQASVYASYQNKQKACPNFQENKHSEFGILTEGSATKELSSRMRDRREAFYSQ